MKEKRAKSYSLFCSHVADILVECVRTGPHVGVTERQPLVQGNANGHLRKLRVCGSKGKGVCGGTTRAQNVAGEWVSERSPLKLCVERPIRMLNKGLPARGVSQKSCCCGS